MLDARASSFAYISPASGLTAENSAFADFHFGLLVFGRVAWHRLTLDVESPAGSWPPTRHPTRRMTSGSSEMASNQ